MRVVALGTKILVITLFKEVILIVSSIFTRMAVLGTRGLGKRLGYRMMFLSSIIFYKSELQEAFAYSDETLVILNVYSRIHIR